MKKLFAIAAAASMLAATGTAFAADRLVDDQMDSVTAGAIDFSQNNVAIISNSQDVKTINAAVTVGGYKPDATVYSSVKAYQNTYVSQQNCRFAFKC
ncbi:hypothetical protein [Caulobacter sp. 17J65-9]|uniref:hypothetical protein n=1 Tax=Caulobacter sp. 17J65-9 TaxID=2709382 RepID=UPI0013C5CB4B|nr:hypothetical protein [Caulobacter sp. 17J65-9]NEX94942.1 hypothetical protein [Caulobacter sp. 17J65-9]